MKERPSRRRFQDIAHLPAAEYQYEAMKRRVKTRGSQAGCHKKRKPDPEGDRFRSIRRRYGLTQTEYLDLLQKQGETCAVCTQTEDLVVDHCHDGGHVRGLLCRKCNVAVGMMEDDAVRLERAAAYLRQ